MTGLETITRIRFEHFRNGKGIKRSAARECSYKLDVQPRPKLDAWIERLSGS